MFYFIFLFRIDIYTTTERIYFCRKYEILVFGVKYNVYDTYNKNVQHYTLGWKEKIKSPVFLKIYQVLNIDNEMYINIKNKR